MTSNGWKRKKQKEDSKHIRTYTHKGIGGVLHVEKKPGGLYKVDMHREDRAFFGRYKVYEDNVASLSTAIKEAKKVMEDTPRNY